MGSRYARPRLPDRSRGDTRLWLAAILTFGVGDFVTTGAGLSIAGVEEGGPFVKPLIQQYGMAAMAALKVGGFAICYLAWMALPRPQCIGIPLGLALLGTVVTGWNTLVVLAVLMG
jgi:hypothetical protein